MYMQGAQNVSIDGLLAETHLPGYRSIWNYLLVKLVMLVGNSLGIATPELPPPGVMADFSYSVGAITIYSVTAILMIAKFSHVRGFAAMFSAIYLNPVTLAHVPIPLQESQMVLFLLPIMSLSYFALRLDKLPSALIFVSALAAAAWMIKASLLLVSIPLLVLWIYLSWKSRERSHAVYYWAASIVLAGLILSPQIYVAALKFNSLYPYPSTDLLSSQLIWGRQMWKWETVLLELGTASAHPAGRALLTPFQDPIEASYFAWAISRPIAAIAVAGGHLVAAFDYSSFLTYVEGDNIPPISINNVIVGFVIFTGLFSLAKSAMEGTYRTSDAVVDIVMIGAAAVLPFIAVETRFSLLPMVVLSFRSLRWLPNALHKRSLPVLGLAIAFGLIFAVAARVLYHSVKLF